MTWKQSSNETNIERRADGWYATLDQDGVRKKESGPWPTREDAEDFLSIIKAMCGRMGDTFYDRGKPQ